MCSIKKLTVLVSLTLICTLTLTACGSFYDLFVEEDGGDDGVYYVIYDENSTDEELTAIPDVHLMAGDLRDEIKTYGLSYEVTIAFDTETDTDATLTCYYYHNREDENAPDFCRIGMTYLGTYTMEADKIIFHVDHEGINIATYTVGSDYANLEPFQQFSYAEDKGNGVWAYADTTWDYSDAVIDDAILEGVPETVEFTVSGNQIVTWKALD